MGFIPPQCDIAVNVVFIDRVRQASVKIGSETGLVEP